MKIDNFFAELKRCNVYKVAIAYVVVGWLLVQVATQVFPFFEIPNWAVRLVVLAIVIGFPVALIIAWVFELTPRGIETHGRCRNRTVSRDCLTSSCLPSPVIREFFQRNFSMRPPLSKHASKFSLIKLHFRKRTRTLTYEQRGGWQSTADGNGISLHAHIHALYGLVLQHAGKNVLMIGCGGGTLGTMLSEQASGYRLLRSTPSQSGSQSAILVCRETLHVMWAMDWHSCKKNVGTTMCFLWTLLPARKFPPT